MSNLMEMEVYNAAVNGDLTIFSIKDQEQLLKKTYKNNNIIHVAAQHQQRDFIKAALNSFPITPTCESLICDQNCKGDTPFHIAAEVGDESVIYQLYEFFSKQCGTYRPVLPWRVMNEEGNTPAHVALLYSNVPIAMYLVEKDGYVARIFNLSEKTLLHLAIQFHDFDNYESQIPERQATSSSKKVYQPRADLWPIIELLLKRESSVVCWADADGLTPLHRAASLEPAYCIRVIKAMLSSCPEAAEVHDKRSGQTVLHFLTNKQVVSYEEGLQLLQIPQVYAIRHSKNHQGDTPLHLAARNRDTTMVQVLLESSPRLCLKNNCGVSAGSLVRQLDETRLTETPVEERRKLTKEEYEAAKVGNVEFLEEKMVSLGMNFLVSQTPKGGNILHIIMQYYSNHRGRINEFIEQSIQRLPLLIYQKDCNGNTPIHVLAESDAYSVTLLLVCYNYLKIAQEEARSVPRSALSCSPWRLKNAKGDTPLHVAVRAQKFAEAIKLLEFDEELARYVNHRNQTALHLLAHHKDIHSDYHNEVDELIRRLIIENPELPYMQDEDGLTPLLTAVREHNKLVIKKVYELSPNCSKVSDFKGRTLWHWFVSRRNDIQNVFLTEDRRLMGGTCEFLIQQTKRDHDIRRLMASKDNDGNTPLHLAIANERFYFAQFFLDNGGSDDWGGNKYGRLLSVVNKEGVSCYNLIASAEHLPREFMTALYKNGRLLDYGYRSIYNIPRTKIEAYANTIGIVAALLATITFTAAFTVPGGLESSSGTPVLLRKATFQVFMVADVVAMCSSMMVLFCLLWIMATSDTRDSELLIDVSVFLLQTSFHATIVTFMTGLYVTTISIVPALAISTCVVCTLLIIVMHKGLVMLTVVPFCGVFMMGGHMLKRFVSNQLSSLWSSIKPRCPC